MSFKYIATILIESDEIKKNIFLSVCLSPILNNPYSSWISTSSLTSFVQRVIPLYYDNQAKQRSKVRMNRMLVVTLFAFPGVTHNETNRKYQTISAQVFYKLSQRTVLNPPMKPVPSHCKTTTIWFMNEAVWSTEKKIEAKCGTSWWRAKRMKCTRNKRCVESCFLRVVPCNITLTQHFVTATCCRFLKVILKTCNIVVRIYNVELKTVSYNRPLP